MTSSEQISHPGLPFPEQFGEREHDPMRISYPVVAAVVVASTLAAAGCSSHSKSSTPASGSTSTSSTHAALSGDYTTLLI